MLRLPGPLRLNPSFPFAGRARELATLAMLTPRVEGQGLQLVLIGGEAGSGKSRLVREFAREAADSGALILYGACDAVVRRPYRPFVEALEQLVRDSEPTILRTELGPEGGELSRLLPELAASVGELPAPVAADPDTERHRLHSAVADVLVAVSRRKPLVVVIEDLHWADTPTLLLVRHLARGAPEARALLVATFRDTDAEVPQALSAALADLRRSEGLVRLRLEGLSTDEVSEFVARASGEQLGADVSDLARPIHELTAGNAFLITELWRSLIETHVVLVDGGVASLAATATEIGSPEGVREVVSQRVARLSPATTAALDVAAVAGPEFDLEMVRAAELGEPELREALAEATAHGMIEEVSGRRLSYRFTHELVRRALYDRMPSLRRAELHLRVAESLERGWRTGDTRGLAELAYHFGAAAAIDGPRRASGYALLAGRAAFLALDFDEAEARLEDALEFGIEDPRLRAETELELGDARFRAGRSDAALAAYRAAAQIARELGDAELLVRAAIGFEDACWRPGIIDEGAVQLLEEADRTLGAESNLRVMLLSGLSRAHAFAGDFEASAVAEERALATARALGDQLGLATVLMRSYWSHPERDAARTVEMISESRIVAEGLGETQLQLDAMVWRVAGLIEIGELRTAEHELFEVRALALRLRQPFALHVSEHYASTLALCFGRLDEAESAAERSREWSRLLTGRAATGIHGIQMFGVRREQGRLAELAVPIRALTDSRLARTAWRPGYAALLAELGMDAEARRELARIRDRGFDELRLGLWVASLAYLTDACAAVGDRSIAALLYPELAPMAGGNIVVGHGVACYGAADRYLGLLAATLDDHALAITHFEQALAFNREIGATTWVAHTLYAYGRTLRMRGRGDDATRASELLSEAALLAERIGLPTLLARASALGARAQGEREWPDELSEREVEILRLVAVGHSNREIGAQLFISGHTVANHVRNILRKTGAANRTDAAGYAYRKALLERDRDR
ncbi:MAG: helix-turn-helix transcriptional regulator [Solirubrobacteraceae bacterium]